MGIDNPTLSVYVIESDQIMANGETEKWALVSTFPFSSAWITDGGLSDQAMTVWQQLLDAGVKPAGLGARDTLRLEAGMNLYGQDMDESQNPLESGLTWTLDFTDVNREFIGKSALVKRRAEDDLKTFLGLILQDKGVLRAHQKVVTAQGAGETTSGSFAPTLNRSIAFARMPPGVKPSDIVEVEVRDKLLKAMVVKPPFARNGKPLL